MSIRIGVDLDGTLADLSAVYHEYEQTLFGAKSDDAANEAPADDAGLSDKARLKAAKADAARRDEVWRALRNTADLWTLLKPIEAHAVRELYEAMLERNWEVFFVTQRPKSVGASVQMQTQRWLIEQGFESPSVLTLTGSRGKAAHALDLDFLIDDLPKNCIDVISDSRCRPILVMREPNDAAESSAKKMQIGVVRSVHDAIELLKQPKEVPRASMVSTILHKLGIAH